jgi:hypothetical protein
MNDFRSLLIDLCNSKQIIGIEWRDSSVSHGRVVNVGSDYALFELLDVEKGGVRSMPAVPLAGIESVNLRPIYKDSETPADMARSVGGS